MMRADEIRKWVDQLPDDELIGINDDGMALETVRVYRTTEGDQRLYLEIGGLPQLDADEDAKPKEIP